jgi:sterol desaturase/sphingolipid hydroxylase (fatty acid hydroxylase superfamily)
MTALFAILPFLLAAIISAVERVLNPARADWLRNVQAWAFYTFAGLVFLPLFEALHTPSLIDGAALPFWIAFPLFLLVRDAGEFIYHRAQHCIPALWAMHSLHHSDPNMSSLTTQRHYWADQLVKAATVWPAALLIITPTPLMLGAYVLASLYNFFIHARLKVDFGDWSWVLNCPAYHRRHHSSQPEHFNSNYAALFPIFDVICGTYHHPNGYPQTGLERRPMSFADLVLWPLRHDGRQEKSAENDGASAASAS